jgi:DnaJ-class molecular chaperone
MRICSPSQMLEATRRLRDLRTSNRSSHSRGELEELEAAVGDSPYQACIECHGDDGPARELCSTCGGDGFVLSGERL